MKRTLTLLFAVVLSISMMSFAQYGSTDSQSGSGQGAGQGSGQGSGMHGDRDRMRMDPQEMVNHLDQQLSLTADQKSKITTILENNNKHAQELMSNNSGDHQANHEAMRQLHENTHAQIRATLTADQQTKFDSMMKDHEKMDGKHHHDKSTSTSTTTTDSTTESPK